MKKILSIILSTAFIFTALTACGGGSSNETTKGPTDAPGQTTAEEDETTAPPAETTEEPAPELDLGGRSIRYASWWDLTPVPGDSEETDKLIARYEQMEADYNFTFEYVNIPWEDYQRTYITNAMGGDAIGEVAIVEYNWLYPNLALNGFVTDLNELDGLNFGDDKWNQDVRNLTTFSGETYGMETGRTFPVGILFWNKSMFERESVDPIYEDVLSGDWTWDDALEIAQKLTKDTDGDGVTDQWGISGTILIPSFVHSNGGQVVDISNWETPKFNLLSDEALRGFQEFQDWVQIHKVVEQNPEGAAWDYARTQFINGNVGMFAGQWWMVDSMKSDMQDEYGIALFPMGPDSTQYASHSTAFNVTTMPETVENKDDVAFIHNLRTEPLEDADPDDWRIYFEDRVTDSESVDVIEMLQDEGLTVLDVTSSFNGLVELSYSYNYQIENAVETPQAAIGAIADSAQNLIDTAMKLSPDDIVDILTPDDGE